MKIKLEKDIKPEKMKGKHKNKNYNGTCDKMVISIRLLDLKSIEDCFPRDLDYINEQSEFLRLRIILFSLKESPCLRDICILKFWTQKKTL